MLLIAIIIRSNARLLSWPPENLRRTRVGAREGFLLRCSGDVLNLTDLYWPKDDVQWSNRWKSGKSLEYIKTISMRKEELKRWIFPFFSTHTRTSRGCKRRLPGVPDKRRRKDLHVGSSTSFLTGKCRRNVPVLEQWLEKSNAKH